MNDAYSLYNKHKEALAASRRGFMDEVIECAITGKKPSWTIEHEKAQEELKKKWNKITLSSCCHCGKKPEVAEGIDCGIDGGPSPCTVHGLKIKCNCGMQTGTYHYRGDFEKLVSYKKCSIEWNKLK